MTRKHTHFNQAILVELTSIGSDTKTTVHKDTKFFLETVLLEDGIYARIRVIVKRDHSQSALTFDKYDLSQSDSVIAGIVRPLTDFHKQDGLSLPDRHARIVCETIAASAQLYISMHDADGDKAFTLKFGENYANTRYGVVAHMAPFFLATTSE